VRASSETLVTLPPEVALHARPAAEFVRTAMGFDASVVVASNGREADAKSLLSVLSLGATGGTRLLLTAEGDDAAVAIAALAGCIARFDEIERAAQAAS
jgi:phosphotransferase system HPr (HPr) family protein